MTSIGDGAAILYVRRELLEDLMRAYLEWRQESAGLVRAYDGWASGAVADHEMAFAAYRAALDREQQASAVYSDRVARVRREAASRGGPLSRLWHSAWRPLVRRVRQKGLVVTQTWSSSTE